ncbi:MAG: hypothetical protein OSJ70_02140 [Bacilli bacterium]|nr:hypothetical protein [Bacilli bacterium]
MKKISVLLIAILSAFIVVDVVKAMKVHAPFSFNNKGDLISLYDQKSGGNITIAADIISDSSDSSLNLNLSKKVLWYYDFISLSVKSIYQKNHVESTWTSQSSGNYRGNIVLNTHNDSITVQGEGYLFP